MSPITQPRKIAIVGTGYVGLTTGACLAHLGFDVVCCDIDASKIALLESGRIPIVETGLEDIVRSSRAAGRLTFAYGLDPATREADIAFLCVPTPQDEDGSADLAYVKAAAAELAPLLPPGAIVVNKSTVPVGAFGLVADTLARDDVAVVSNPEFLREGSAVHDFLHPDRIVIGADDRAAAERLAGLYALLGAPVVFTDPASAELIKYAANGFLAMKISFVNSVATLCEQVGADVASVVEGIGTDRRIGPQFLSPGPGWGGSCFPKDTRALVAIAADHGYDFSLMRGVININEQQYDRMVGKVAAAVGRPVDAHADLPLAGVVVGALGLTFKAGTDDLRESPSLHVLDRLAALGARIRAYDPTTVGALTPAHRERLEGFDLALSPQQAAFGADVVVVLTEWPEFRVIDLPAIAEVMRGDALVDTRNLFDGDDVRAAGLRYTGVGRS